MALLGVGLRHLGMEGVLVVGDASDGQQTGSLWEVQPSHGRLLLSHICRVTHGEGSVAPGLGKGAHTSGDSMGHTLGATRWALGLTGLSGLGDAHLHPDLGILWAKGQHWAGRRGSPGPSSCPPHGSGLAAVAELVLSQRSAITHWRSLASSSVPG